jgi:hypothetical protein
MDKSRNWCYSSYDKSDLFQFKTINWVEIKKALRPTEMCTVTGPGTISGSDNDYSIDYGTSYLCFFNLSFLWNDFPKTKNANVSAIWKGKGSKKGPINNVPSSVLPFLSLVCEKVVFAQLYAFWEAAQLMPTKQFGLWKRSSCAITLLAALDFWKKKVDSGKYTAALLTDLSRAFDLGGLPHHLLPKVLPKYRMQYRYHQLVLQLHLEGRRERMKWGA